MRFPELLNLKRLIEQLESRDDDERKVLHDGEVLDALNRSEGWKLVLDEMERMADENIGTLKKMRPWNPWKCQSAMIRYQESERLLHRLQDFVISRIQDRQMVLELRKKEQEEEQWRTMQ
jgi:hypothetical protein